jgi:hypothetical protein
VNREAELPAPTGVGSGDLLGCWLIFCENDGKWQCLPRKSKTTEAGRTRKKQETKICHRNLSRNNCSANKGMKQMKLAHKKPSMTARPNQGEWRTKCQPIPQVQKKTEAKPVTVS